MRAPTFRNPSIRRVPKFKICFSPCSDMTHRFGELKTSISVKLLAGVEATTSRVIHPALEHTRAWVDGRVETTLYKL